MKFLKSSNKILLYVFAFFFCWNLFSFNSYAGQINPQEVKREYPELKVSSELSESSSNFIRIPIYKAGEEYYANFHDIAYGLQTHYAGFDIKWNDALSRTELILHTPYSRKRDFYWESYYNLPDVLNPWWAKVTFWINNQGVEVSGFVYDKQFYMPIKDLGKLVGYSVVQDKKRLEIISTSPKNLRLLSEKGLVEFFSYVKFSGKWATPKQSYLYQEKDKIFSVHLFQEPYKRTESLGTLYIDKYDLNFKLLDRKVIQNYGELFGGFYHGKKYNYLVFGNKNPKQDSEKVVLTVVQMDHNFKEIKKVDVKNCYTVVPFDYGSLSMAEYDDLLIIHTARTRYLTEDGLNHQSQLTVGIDTKTMNVFSDNLGPFQENHVSHSFNQFAFYDEKGKLYLFDHGDAYPRSIVVHKMDSKMKQVEKELNIFRIEGQIGANQTGVSIGDVEQGKDHFFVGVNQIDYKKAKRFDSYEIYGEDVDRRDVYVYVVDKNLNQSKSIRLTDYSKDKEKTTYSAPYIVKMNDKQFVVLWIKDFLRDENTIFQKPEELQYVLLNEKGEKLGDIKTLPWHFLGESKPIFVNGKIYTLLRNINGAVALSEIDVKE